MSRIRMGFPYLLTAMAWWTLAVMVLATGMAVVMIIASTPWFASERHTAGVLFTRRPMVDNVLLFFHAITALPPLAIGLWQFSPATRQRRLALHRLLGKVYVICILISSVLGLLLASVNRFGIVARLGFSALAIVWFSTTFMAYYKVRNRDVMAHRRWMLRSYAITLAVISVRFLPNPYDLPMETWYPLMTWFCWVPNLIVAEIYVRMTDYGGRLQSDARNQLATKANRQANPPS